MENTWTVRLAGWRWGLGPMLVALCGCTTLVRGPTQSVMVDTTPTGAVCVAEAAGQAFGRFVTPAVLQVPRSPAVITLHCYATGFTETDVALRPVTSFLGTGSPFLDLPLLAADAASGSVHSYPDHITVRLVEETGLIIGNEPPPHYFAVPP